VADNVQNIKVSVIIPIYNAEKYLAECLDSVIGQSLQNIEILCVDDGSTDNSLSILKEYVKKDERIGAITQANQGAGNARNAGIALAQGEYLAFMDADDLYYPEALGEAYIKAINTNADMVAFEAEYFDGHKKCSVSQLNKLLLAGRSVYSAQTEPKYLFQIATCNPWCKLFRRGFVLENNLQYQEIKTANDLCFVCSAMAKAAKNAVLDKILVKHRVLHKGNLQSVKVRTPLDFWSALLMLKQNLQNFGLWDKLKRSYINCALAHCVYNWQTLDKPGRNQITAKSQEIAELLEFGRHSERYYYNRNDYELMCKVVGLAEKGGAVFMSKLKDMLKYILPPPVKAFNREVAGIKQYMLELNASLEIQQKRQMEILQEQQQKQLELLSRQYTEQMAVLESKNRAQLDLLRQQQIKMTDIEKQQKNIKERLQELDRLSKIQTNIESVKTEIVQKQNEKITELSDSLEKEIADITCLQKDIAQKIEDELQKRQLALFNDVKAELDKPVKRDYDYYEDLFTNRYEKELKIWYKAKTGEDLNLQNPKTFNEKIQWLKLYDSTPLKTRLADKYLVREWVAEKIGAEYLIPLLGVWDSFDEIDFDKLPERFVLKANHGYHWNYIVTDKSLFNKEEAKAKFDEWLNTNFAFKGLELHYMNIPPKIIADEYLENEENDLYDYKVFCFGGKAEIINYISGRNRDVKEAYFDLNWRKLPFTTSFARNNAEISKPKNLELLIELAEKLAAGFPHVRVDFYILNDGSLKFGEMTFTTANGLDKWDPPEYNRVYGDLLKLPPKSPIPERI